jgi:antitoxin StbD
MTVKASASEIQKNFGYWHDKALKEPVQVTKHGRETTYLVSAETFNELWASFRRAVRVEELSDAEVTMITSADIAPEDRYEVDQLQKRKSPSNRR